MSSRKEVGLLMRISIHRIVDKIGTDPAVVEKRIPFRRGAVSGYGFCFFFGFDQKVKEFTLSLLDSLAEREIAFQPV